MAKIALFDIALQELDMKVIADGVVDEALLSFGFILCLVLKHDVLVPPPLDSKVWR